MSYQKRRNWADQYNSHLNQIAASIIFSDPRNMGVYFKAPSSNEDMKLGIDCWIDVARTKISYRIRDAKKDAYFLKGFTIRTSVRHGSSELEKLHEDNYADFLLYALAHPENYGEVGHAVLIDLKLVGSQLSQFPHITENAVKGKGFIDFSYDSFPTPVVVGMYGMQEKTIH